MSIVRMRGFELLQLSIPFCLKEVNSRESNGVCSISFWAAMVLLANYDPGKDFIDDTSAPSKNR